MIVRFNGLDLADETRFLITSITGWDDMPELVSGTAVRPRRHGSWPGGLLATKRVVVVDFEILADPRADNTTTAAVQAVRKAMAISDNEQDLVVDLDYGIGEEAVKARVTSLLLPMQKGYGTRRSASIEFTATDPRRYKSVWTTKSFGTRTRSVIPSYPIKYPKGYAAYGNPGDLAVVNEGYVDTPPIFRVTGPITTPSITITDSKGVRKVTFDLALSAGKTMVLDVQAGTARQGATSYYGDSRGALLEDMNLRPGLSTIHFAGTGNGSSNARLQVEWRSANL
jgi:Phage tail protein